VAPNSIELHILWKSLTFFASLSWAICAEQSTFQRCSGLRFTAERYPRLVMHQSIFSYGLSRPIPYEWFTPLVVIGGICALALTSVLNFISTGYYLRYVFSHFLRSLLTSYSKVFSIPQIQMRPWLMDRGITNGPRTSRLKCVCRKFKRLSC
jgi:hypothetical protein